MNEQLRIWQLKDMACVAIHSHSNRAFCAGSDVKAKTMRASLIGRSYSTAAARDREITKKTRENGIGFSPKRRFRYGYDRRSPEVVRTGAPLYGQEITARKMQQRIMTVKAL